MCALRKCAVVAVTVLMMLGSLVVLQPPAMGDGPMVGPAILKVGGQDKMKTRNPLPAIANDIWTRDVLDRVYDTLGRVAPETEALLPYIIKGIDANEDGVFQANEYGVFTKNPGTNPLDVIAFYDFNGVYFHDAVQANEGDLYFSYQLQGLNPRMNLSLRVLMDKAGKSGSNYTVTRWLFMTPFPKVWENEPAAGNSSLRFAVRFLLQEPFALFARQTLVDVTLYPRHVWEGVGWRWDTKPPGCSWTSPCMMTPLHVDFGLAIYPETDARFPQGIPTTETLYKPFVYLNSGTPAQDSAEEWMLTDDDVIGTGPFEFDYFYDASATALVTTFIDYYTGNDSRTGAVIDPYIATYVNVPHIDGIAFNVYASLTLGILALMAGNLDFYLADIPPEYLPTLSSDPNMALWTSPERGFTYLGYNMRRPSMGLWKYGMADQFDIGFHFRKAVAHLINKTRIVDSFLSGYGVPGVVPLSPQNIKFYNASLMGYGFDVSQALTEMGLAHADAVWLSMNGGPAEAATWYTKDPGTGKYILPGIGTAEFYLWCPNADYDPVKANSCTMIANEMNNLSINVRARPAALSAIIAMMNAHDFDMYIHSWEIHTGDPDYLYAFFHSSQATAGLNYPGANFPMLDWTLDESRMELNESLRVVLLQWAQQMLLDELPYDTLYFRTRIEASRNDRFIGWIPDIDTIWNYWSLLNLTPVSVNTPPIADFTVNPPSGDTSTFFSLDASSSMDIEDPITALEVRWDWEDDGTWDTGWTTSKTAQHLYSSPETYSIRLEVLDTEGLKGNATKSLQVTAVNTPPVAAFTVTPAQGGLGTDFAFDASSSWDAEDLSSVLEVMWDWEDDGTWDTSWSAVKTAQHQYGALGTYTACLIVRDSGNLTDTTTRQVLVSNTPPVASFEVLPLAGDITTTFSVDSSGVWDQEDPPSVLEVRWDWEDDGTWDSSWTTTKTAGHIYAAPANYTIRLEVRDTGGMTGTSVQQVEVYNTPPTAAFAVSPLGGDTGTVWTFNASASHDLEDPTALLEVRWDWDGDGTWDTGWSSEKVATHQYASPGNYTVRLEVRDTDGLVNVTTKYVPVEQPATPPSAEFPILLLIVGIAVALGMIVFIVYVRRRRAKKDQEPPEGQTHE